MKFILNNEIVEFDEITNELVIKGKNIKSSIRLYDEMKDLYFKNSDRIKGSTPCYFMYRGVYLSKEDSEKFKKFGLRYDITIIPPLKINGEFNKTFGHYHPKNSKGKFYEEMYEVLDGEAIYLQQNDTDCFYTKTELGNVILMQSGYGHITINPTNNYLVMGNIVSDNFSSKYNDIKSKKGGRYYFFKSGWVKNDNYDDNIEIKYKNINICMNNIYKSFIDNPDNFSFLN